MLSAIARNLTTLIFIGILIGVLLGISAPEFALALRPIGQVFLRLLMVLIVPVVFFSVLTGVLGLGNGSAIGRVGSRAFFFYFVTTALAVATGLALVNVIAPGSAAFGSVRMGAQEEFTLPKAGLADLADRLVPANIIAAAAEGNVLGLIVFAIAFGVALLCTGHIAVPAVAAGLTACNAAIMKLVDVVMLIAPLGVCGLVASLVGDFVERGVLTTLGSALIEYAVVVVIGLLLHAGISLSVIARAMGISPWRLFRAVLPALTTAFSTASSAATLPVTIDALERRAGVSPKTAGFVAPLGATINMDGTALYEAVAVLFIATMYGVTLTATDQVIVFLTATGAAVGAAAIPGAGLIMMALVLGSVGLPLEGIQLVIVVDRLLDMLRTSVNVWGDCVGSVIVARREGEQCAPVRALNGTP